jgi:hypothetical protein
VPLKPCIGGSRSAVDIASAGAAGAVVGRSKWWLMGLIVGCALLFCEAYFGAI